MTHAPFEVYLLVAGVMLLLSILASKASNKLGVPSLVLFIVLGMLAGSEGLGGIDFSNYELARELGIMALAFILFAGGIDTKWSHVRPMLGAGISLATIGVTITAGIIGGGACLLLGFSPLLGILLGSVVSSTDAAAVFGVLKARKIHLSGGIQPLLELESGINDPMAVFLTTGITGLLVHPERSALSLIPDLAISLVLGLCLGYVLGLFGAWLLNRVRLESAGLYPAITIGIALVSFGGAHLIGGNEFLAVYTTALTLGTRNFLHKQSLIAFHDGLAWLMQIAMFLVLGLLIFPGRLLQLTLPGLMIAVLLVFVARPAAVFVALAFSKRFKRGEKLFISWTGLRGAVPIILAIIPLTAGVKGSETIFNIVFFAVLVSVLVQGTLIDRVANYLRVKAPGSTIDEHQHQNMVDLVLDESSPAVGKQVVDLRLPRWALVLLVTRDGESFVPQGSTDLRSGDRVLLVTRKEDLGDLSKELGGTPTDDPMEDIEAMLSEPDDEP